MNKETRIKTLELYATKAEQRISKLETYIDNLEKEKYDEVFKYVKKNLDKIEVVDWSDKEEAGKLKEYMIDKKVGINKMIKIDTIDERCGCAFGNPVYKYELINYKTKLNNLYAQKLFEYIDKYFSEYK